MGEYPLNSSEWRDFRIFGFGQQNAEVVQCQCRTKQDGENIFIGFSIDEPIGDQSLCDRTQGDENIAKK